MSDLGKGNKHTYPKRPLQSQNVANALFSRNLDRIASFNILIKIQRNEWHWNLRQQERFEESKVEIRSRESIILIHMKLVAA